MENWEKHSEAIIIFFLRCVACKTLLDNLRCTHLAVTAATTTKATGEEQWKLRKYHFYEIFSLSSSLFTRLVFFGLCIRWKRPAAVSICIQNICNDVFAQWFPFSLRFVFANAEEMESVCEHETASAERNCLRLKLNWAWKWCRMSRKKRWETQTIKLPMYRLKAYGKSIKQSW